MLLPRPLCDHFNNSLALCRNCCWSAVVVLNAHRSLHSDVHRNRCFLLPRIGAQYQLGLVAQFRAKAQEPLALPVQLEHLAHRGRPLRSARPRRGWSESRLHLWSSPSPASVQRRATPRLPCLLFAVCSHRLAKLAVIRVRRRGIECCGPSMEGE